MNASDTNNKRYKRPKQKTSSTTKPEATEPKNVVKSQSPPLCPLLAKDSEWVDILQPTPDGPSTSGPAGASHDQEAVLQLVECEDGPQTKPLAIMFPDLIEKDPLTLEGVLNKAMSTTEVTKHLVDLGQKANFTCMKKSTRLIPKEKQWLEKVMEDQDNTSPCSLNSSFFMSNMSSNYDADTEVADEDLNTPARRRRRKSVSESRRPAAGGSQDTLDGMEHAPQLPAHERPPQDKLNITLAKRRPECSKGKRLTK